MRLALGGRPLAGVGVLIVRPTAQAVDLAQQLAPLGATPLPFAALEVMARADLDDQAAARTALATAAVVIFTSANAVRLGMPHLLPWPSSRTTLAIGPATALALAQFGVAVAAVPAQTDSDGLLALPELAAVAHQTVVIVGGEGGRDRLMTALHDRGAVVHKLAVYQRVRGQGDVAPIQALGAAGLIHFALVTSSETLQFLVDALVTPEPTRSSHWLWRTRLLLLSERTAQLARAQGFTAMRVVPHASDAALISALLDWHAYLLETSVP